MGIGEGQKKSERLQGCGAAAVRENVERESRRSGAIREFYSVKIVLNVCTGFIDNDCIQRATLMNPPYKSNRPLSGVEGPPRINGSDCQRSMRLQRKGGR